MNMNNALTQHLADLSADQHPVPAACRGTQGTLAPVQIRTLLTPDASVKSIAFCDAQGHSCRKSDIN